MRRGGLVLEHSSRTAFEFIKVHHQPDSSFPNGWPNPMLEESASTVEAMRGAARISPRWMGFRPLLLLR